jgi:hypothetical protein
MTGIPVSVNELVDTPTINEWARVHWRQTSLIDIVSSTTETDLFGTQGSGIQISAGALSSIRKIRFEVDGDFIGNSTSQGFTLRLYFGGTKLWDSGLFSNNFTSAKRAGMFIEGAIAMLGATNSEHARVAVQLGQVSGAATTGDGVIALAANVNGIGITDTPAAIDETVAQYLRLTAQLNISSSGLEMRVRYASLEAV